jgi:nucleotide-binding universal stress UspA family protein
MSEYCVVVAVSNPASVDPLTKMGCTLAEANDGIIKIASVKQTPPQLPAATYDEFGSKEEAIIDRALAVADSFDARTEGVTPFSRDTAESIVSLIDRVDASALLVGASELTPFKESWLGRSLIETITERVTCDVYAERIGPGLAVPGGSILVPIADGTHADAVVRVATDIGRVHDMRVELVTVVSPTADPQTISRSEKRLRAHVPDGSDPTVQTDVVLGDSIVATLVELTGDHDVTVLGATEQSSFEQLLSGTIPTALARRSRNPLVLVNSSS